MHDIADILGLAFLAAAYPTLLAAVTVMLLAPNPRPLMLGYLLGAYTTGIGLGIVIVFSLNGSSAPSTARNTFSPAVDILVGLILLSASRALASGRVEELQEKRRKRKAEKDTEGKEPFTQRLLAGGSPRTAYAAAVLLSFPGASYLVALHRMSELDSGSGVKVALVITFCLIQLLLLEVPLLGYTFAPERTKRGVAQLREWLSRNGRQGVIIVTATLGLLAIARGVISLL